MVRDIHEAYLPPRTRWLRKSRSEWEQYGLSISYSIWLRTEWRKLRSTLFLSSNWLKPLRFLCFLFLLFQQLRTAVGSTPIVEKLNVMINVGEIVNFVLIPCHWNIVKFTRSVKMRPFQADWSTIGLTKLNFTRLTNWFHKSRSWIVDTPVNMCEVRWPT